MFFPGFVPGKREIYTFDTKYLLTFCANGVLYNSVSTPMN